MTEPDTLAYPPRGLSRDEAAPRPQFASVYKDRHGKQRWRFRRGDLCVPLPGGPGDEDFEIAYLAAFDGCPIRRPKRKSPSLAPRGLVYAIQSLPETPIKIGFSAASGLERRIAVLQTGNPYQLRVVAQTEGYQRHERIAHAALVRDRLSGEWFSWNLRTAAFVSALPAGIEIALAAIRG